MRGNSKSKKRHIPLTLRQQSFSYLSAISLTSLALSFLIHFIMLRATSLNQQSTKYFCLDFWILKLHPSSKRAITPKFANWKISVANIIYYSKPIHRCHQNTHGTCRMYTNVSWSWSTLKSKKSKNLTCVIRRHILPECMMPDGQTAILLFSGLSLKPFCSFGLICLPWAWPSWPPVYVLG